MFRNVHLEIENFKWLNFQRDTNSNKSTYGNVILTSYDSIYLTVTKSSSILYVFESYAFILGDFPKSFSYY